MTKILSAALVLGLMAAGPAFAQADKTGPGNVAPAGKHTDSKMHSGSTPSGTAAPSVATAAEMDMTRATSRLQAQGYTDITGLKPEGDGWSAMATKDGKRQTLLIDRNGGISNRVVN